VSLTPAEFEAALRRVGSERYHDKHPFNLRMHEGTLTRAELRLWVRNRYYYQTRIPVKDGLILSKSGDPGFRREWVRRIHDHDGRAPGEGGLELWLALAEAVGLDRDETAGLRHVLPGVKRACDAYVEFVASNDLLASVAASLTELFAGDIMRVRIAAFRKHYAWVDEAGLRYFESRTLQAPRDARDGLAFVIEHAPSEADQARCIAALVRKCEILWGLLDAVEAAGAAPALVPHALVRENGGEVLVVLPERAVKTNATGRRVLALCDGRKSGDEIAIEIAREEAAQRGADPARVHSDVHAFLDELARAGAIRREIPAPDASAGTRPVSASA
jgi:pyrroloquinoline-quinone synthase